MARGIIDSEKNPYIRSSWIEQNFSFTPGRQQQLERLLGKDYKTILDQKPDNFYSYVAFVAIRWGFAIITNNILFPTFRWNHRQHFDVFGQSISPFEISDLQALRENQFNEKIFEIYERAKKLCDYNATRFLKKIRHDGGIEAAKTWLNPKNKDKPPTKGFIKLRDNGRLDISLEALVLRDPWNKFFTPEELEVARTRLNHFGYNGIELTNSNAEQLIPEEILTPEKYSEGTKHTITVNAYERNQKARKKCIQHYGPTCIVCDFNFEKNYGTDFRSFIHIHHLRPLSTIAENYNLNPIEDLRPICPNCHAVIHKRNPPYTITEMKKFIKSRLYNGSLKTTSS